MNKFLRFILIALVVVILMTGSFAGGFVTAQLKPIFQQPMVQAPPKIFPPIATPAEADAATPQDLQSLFGPFWESWDLIHTQYVDQPVDDLKLMQGAIRGMLDALGDEHTSYMDPQQFEDANADLAGEYDGIGAWVDPTGDFLTIISPMPDSPAEKAGLKPGDKVIAIDGEDMTGLDGEVVRLKVLGPAGTTVRLTILRDGEEKPLEFAVTREHIVVKSVVGEMREDGIAYVQITTFGENTTRELRQTLDTLIKENPKGMIVDLRNNGGGYLQTAVEVASEFIGKGVILYEQYGDGSRQTYEAIPNGRATEIPLVVLINEGSASASEILAGAIQDYERGKLVGATSYGKGSVQNWIPLSDEQGAVRVTIAKWLTPKERTIHKQGLTPDYEVELTEDDIKAEYDPQLEQAVALLIPGGMASQPPEGTSLPDLPVSSIKLEYDAKTESLLTQDGQKAYRLDTDKKKWIPIIPESLNQTLPGNYEVYSDAKGWVIRSQIMQDLYKWDANKLNWVTLQPNETSSATPSQTENISCPLALPSNLSVGENAQVMTPLNLRSSAGISDNWLQTIDAKTQVEVVGGPVCNAYNDGAYWWWQIRLPGNIIGWVAEGSLKGDYYFLTPVR